MANLYFRYSEIYEHMLSEISGEQLSNEQVRQGYEFVEKYIKHWEQYNDVVFRYYESLGFVIPDFWIAYFIHPRNGMTPFSDPLTLFIKDDIDEITATLVHELAHVVLSYGPNATLWQKLWDHVQNTYPDHDIGANIEIITILLARGALHESFGAEKAEKLLSLEKNYLSLKKAWETIDSQPEVLKELNPIEAIHKLK